MNEGIDQQIEDLIFSRKDIYPHMSGERVASAQPLLDASCCEDSRAYLTGQGKGPEVRTARERHTYQQVSRDRVRATAFVVCGSRTSSCLFSNDK